MKHIEEISKVDVVLPGVVVDSDASRTVNVLPDKHCSWS